MSLAPPIVVPGVPESLEIPIHSLRRFTVEEYHRLIDDGYFAEDEGYELLEGLVVHKMTKKPDHWIAGELLRAAINALAIPGCFFHAQNPIATDHSEPEPDGALILGQLRDYVSGHPDPTKIPLVIEVADSSLWQDRTLKMRIYARARIPAYWIVNLIDRRVEVYTRPSGPIESPNYDDCLIVADDGELPVVIEGREVGRIRVRDILP